MFNRTLFNHTLFNRTEAAEEAGLYTTIPSEYAVEAASLRVQVQIAPLEMGLETELQAGRLGLMQQLPLTEATEEFAIEARSGIYVPLIEMETGIEFALTPAVLRNAESEGLTLTNLNFAPGQTLIIDTDTLDIEIDDVLRVDAWETGGVFFQLKKGDNALAFSDDKQSRSLQVTVLWSDRYL